MENRDILVDLYKKIKPVKAEMTCLNSGLGYIKEFSIEFFLENFTYEDPLSGTTENKDKFNMFFEFSCDDIKLKANTIEELEGEKYIFEDEEIIGSFSNSISFVVKSIEFGHIANDLLEFSMNYVLIIDESVADTFEDYYDYEGNTNVSVGIKYLAYN
jgi:hypothetical protein